ncbi:ABC transporter substrate-binding protein [Pseudonocardia ailaonensis]|uniref:ABC transporter substrate-binding protein n=1 Tax=Pseudonocardia ailaonensis TaxID=367279 RepID=A0ABN2N0S5_9PSEU
MARRTGVIRSLCVVALAATTVAACGTGGAGSGEGGSPSSGGTVTIGMTVPTSGLYAAEGAEMVRGAQLAATTVNDSGGVLGSKIVLDIQDDQSNPQVGVAAVKKFQANGDNAIAAAYNSTVGLAEIETVKREGTPFVSVIASADGITSPNYPNVVATNSAFTTKEVPLTKYVAGKVRTAAFVLSNDDAGRGLFKVYQDAWSGGKGPQILSEAYYQPTDTDYSAIVTKAIAAKPDGLYVTGSAVTISTIMRELKQLNSSIPFVWVSGEQVTPTAIKLAGGLLDGVTTASVYTTSGGDASTQKFTADYRKAYPDQVPQYFSATSYDAIMVVAQAMKGANSTTDKTKIAAAMRKVDFEGARGRNVFDANGRINLTPYVTRVVNGEIQKVQDQ